MVKHKESGWYNQSLEHAIAAREGHANRDRGKSKKPIKRCECSGCDCTEVATTKDDNGMDSCDECADYRMVGANSDILICAKEATKHKMTLEEYAATFPKDTQWDYPE